MKSPIFIFSLPRSGSTLLQRILMSHKDIASVAEPWLLLPFLYVTKQEGVLSEFSQALSSMAIKDFIDNLPNKENDYYKELNSFVNILYAKQCKNNEIYFLDKTPRYYFIIPEIVKVFPNAKFIFLFRNPVHVMSSMVQTWGNGRLKDLYQHERDLILGPKALSDGYALLKDQAFAIQYEVYVTNPEKYIKELCSYLEIMFDDSMLTSFTDQDIKGRMGDSTGILEYNTISHGSLEKWKTTFNTPFRKKLLYKYIENIDENILSMQGYSKKDILNEINVYKCNAKNSIRDWFDYLFSSNMQKISIRNHLKVINKLEYIYKKF